MTKLGQMIWDDALAEGQAQGLAKGLAQGQAQGQQQASERYSKLILILDKEKKNDLIIKVASDPDFAKNYIVNMAFDFGREKGAASSCAAPVIFTLSLFSKFSHCISSLPLL